MPKADPIYTNFTAGELSPRLAGRVDLEKYYNGVKTLENLIVHPHGGASRRPGTYFVAEVKTSSKEVRLIPFEFSTTQAYIIEFGDQYLRFYMDNGQIESAGSPYEIATPYLEADLFELKFAQSADTMYIVHPSHAPRKLTRTAHTAWTLTVVAFTANPFGTADNYPGAVSFYEERLWFAGTNNDPQKLWASKSGSYENMTIGTLDDDALAYTIAADQVNAIRWLVPARTLIVGTVGGEWKISATSIDEPITPTNVNVRRESTHGSANIQAKPIGNAVLFVQRAQRKLRELGYNFDIDGYLSPDMTLLSEHITTPGITNMDYQQEPDSIVWCVRSDGGLLSFTCNRAQAVMSWARHITDGEVESVACIPGATQDELWLSGKRTINGSTKRYVEYMVDTDFGTDQEDCFFVDCGLTYSGAGTSTLSGLDHLEGKSVAILANGAVHPNKTVASGQITLNYEVTKAHVGLAYTSKLQTMRLEAGSETGTAQGKPKRIHAITVRLYQSLGVKIGPTEAKLDTISFRSSADKMDSPPALFTGDKEIPFPSGYDTDAYMWIVQDQPLPLTVLAIMPRLTTFDK